MASVGSGTGQQDGGGNAYRMLRRARHLWASIPGPAQTLGLDPEAAHVRDLPIGEVRGGRS